MVCLKNFNLLRQIHGIFFQFLIINVFFHIMLFSQESYWFSISKFFFFNVASIRKLLDFLEIKIQVEEEKTIANNRDWLVNAIVPHSSALPWRIPWMEEPGWLQSTGLQESDTTERLDFDYGYQRGKGRRDKLGVWD